MRIVFLQELWYEWQAPMLFSSIAKEKGHCTTLYIKSNPLEASKVAIKKEADLIVFSCVTSGNIDYVYKCAQAIKKKRNIPIIVGGPHITLYPNDVIMRDIDFLGVGEGELTFSMLLDYLHNKVSIEQIPGLAYVKEKQLIINPSKIVSNLNILPIMDRDLYYKYKLFKKEKVRMFYSGRGCIHNCSYCCVPQNDFLIRKRSPNDLILEILKVKDKYGLKAAFFQDDSFTQDKEWLNVFLPLYKKYVNKPLMCMSRAADLDSNIIELLSNNGCISIGIGLETSCEKTRMQILNRYESNTHFIEVIEKLREKKIRVTTFNMLGIPGETVEHITDTILFNNSLNVSSAWGVLYQPYKKISGYDIKSCVQTKNFYTNLGYTRQDGKQIESLQRVFPVVVKFPRLLKYANKIPKIVGYFIFAFFSFYREVNIWRRSVIITFITGILNQIQYNKR